MNEINDEDQITVQMRRRRVAKMAM